MAINSNDIPKLKAQFGDNQIVASKGQSLFLDILKILSDPMGMMLLSLAFIYWLMGDNKEAIILLISYIPVTMIDVLLELKTSKALKALGQSLEQKVNVIRDQKVTEILVRDILPGDEMLIEEGQKISADGKIVSSNAILVNEAALTGESIPIEKKAGDLFFAGTVVISGHGIGEVTEIGNKTKFGNISSLLSSSEGGVSPLKKEINKLVKYVFIFAIVLAISIFIYQYILHGKLLESLVEALTFAMAAIPEEFPLVFTIFLSMGAYRLSKHGVLVKSLPSVEALGAVDVLCTDKTGTLTEGIFELTDIIVLDSNTSVEEAWKISRLACEIIPTDLMETEINRRCQFQIPATMQLIYDYAFENVGKHMSHVWRTENDSIIAMKGSIEGVLEHSLCDDQQKLAIEEQVKALAGRGFRLLGVAAKKGQFSGVRAADEQELTFIAILCYRDPIRHSVRAAIDLCQKSGIEIKMITGDHPLTAHAVADELNIKHDHQFIYTGKELEALDTEARNQAYLKGAIFTRVTPAQKYEMIKTLKAAGKTVAMTGDGINDAPALKSADIGIGMGKNATDVARQSAQMILLENNFNGIVEAVIEGRKIFSNLKKSFSYLISFHIPILFFTFIPIVLGYGPLLNPIHIVLLELIVHPISAFTFENQMADTLSSKNFLHFKNFIRSALNGLIFCLITWFFYLHLIENLPVSQARSILLATIIFSNIAFVANECTTNFHRRFYITSLILLIITICLGQFSLLASLFNSEVISFNYYLPIVLISMFIYIMNYLWLKILRAK